MEKQIEPLKEPLIVSEKKELKPSQDVKLDYKVATVEQVFKSFEDQTETTQQSTPIPIDAIKTFITANGNILSFSFREIELWNFSTQKSALKLDGVKGMSYIYGTSSGSLYFVGYVDGKLESRDPMTLAVKQTINLQSKINAMVTDNKILYVSTRNGRILAFPVDDISESTLKVIKKTDRKSPIALLKLSRDNSFLIGYVDIDGQEQFFVFNLKKENDKPWSSKLDLIGGDQREDADKLIYISNNCLNILARGDNKKGVTMYSLFDGTVVTQMDNMHVNYITQFLITKDSKTVITAGKDRKIKIWDWIKQSLLGIMVRHTDSVESILLSLDEKILFSAGLDSQVVIWEMHTFSELCSLKNDFGIRTLELTIDNDYLIVKGADKKLRQLSFWNLEQNDDAFRINADLKGVSNCYITPNNEYLVTMNSNSQLTIWNIKSRTQIEKYIVNCEFKYNLRALNGSKNSEFIFFQIEKGDIIQWSTKTQSEAYTFNHPGQIQDIVFSSDDRYMYCNAQYSIYKWDLHDRKQLAEMVKGGGYYLFLNLSADDKTLYVNGLGAEIWHWDIDNYVNGSKPPSFDIIQSDEWLLFDIGPDNRTLIQTNYYNGSFWVCDLIDKKVLLVLNEHSQQIKFLTFSEDGKFLITKTPTELIVWDTKEWKSIIKIDQEVGTVCSANRRIQAFIYDGLYKPWSLKLLKDFSDDFEIEEENKESGNVDEQTKNNTEFQKSHILRKEDIKITGPLNSIANLLVASMVKVQKDGQLPFIPYLRRNVIQPHKFNLNHYFAFTNNTTCLRQSLSQSCQYTKDIRGNTPIDYAMERKSYESSKILLDYIMNSSTNLYDKMGEEQITKLITFAPSNLKDFFDNAVKVQQNDSFPSFGVLKGEEIAFISTNKLNLDVQDALNIVEVKGDLNNEDAEPIEFSSLQFKFNFAPGSQSSLNFHRALEKANIITFRSLTIQAILTYKWSQVKRRAIFNALIFMLYILDLFIYGITKRFEAEVALCAFVIYFMSFEFLQIKINGFNYILSFWNVFDFATLMMLIIFLFEKFTSQTEPNNQEEHGYLFSVINQFAWFRALSHLRLFQKTRALIRLIVEVSKDMIPFFIVLIVAVTGFSITFSLLNQQQTLGYALKNQYRLMYGDFSPDEYTTANWILFIIASILLPLVMLNLLIAIMSDSYARVMADIVPQDFVELNEMILEQEEVLIFNKGLGQQTFLHYGTYIQRSGEDEWEGQVQRILMSMQAKTGTDQSTLDKLLLKQDQIFNQQLLQTRDTNMKFDEQKKRLDNIQQQIETSQMKFDTQFNLIPSDEAEVQCESDGDFFEIDELIENDKTEVSFKNYLRNQWETLKIDKSGKLEKDEAKTLFQNIFADLGKDPISDKDFENIFSIFDGNGDGKLSKKEAFTFLMRAIQS